MRFFSILFLVISALSVGCATTSSSSPSGDYVLSEVNGSASAMDNVTLSFEGENLSGNGPVNRWRASLKDGKIGPMIATRMAGPQEAMLFEDKMLDVMQGATMTVESDKLVFTKGDNTVTFVRQ